MIKLWMQLFTISFTAVPFLVAFAVQNDAIKLNIEEPKMDSVASGIANLRGWAVSPSGIDYIEYYLDGILVTRVPYGGTRNDIGNAFPGFPDSENSGYSMAVNYSNLTPGSHMVRIVAYDSVGDTNEQSLQFRVARFDNPFIADITDVSPGYGPLKLVGGDSVYLMGTRVEDKYYSIRLSFKRETQGFSISSIVEGGYEQQVRDGKWEGYAVPFNPWVSANKQECHGSKIEMELAKGEITGSGLATDLSAFDIAANSVEKNGVISGGAYMDGPDKIARFSGSITGYSMQGTYFSTETVCGGYWHAWYQF